MPFARNGGANAVLLLNLVTILLTPLFVVFFLVSASLYWTNYIAYLDLLTVHAQESLDLHAATLAARLDRVRHDLRVLAGRREVQHLLAKENDADRLAVRRRLEALEPESGVYERLVLLDRSGSERLILEYRDGGLAPTTLVGPGFFVPMAEREGLVRELTEQMLKEGIAQCAAWMHKGCHHRVAFNISVDLLSDITLPDTIAEMVRTMGVPAGRIVLEVTESRGIANLADTLEVLTRLRLKGFGLSIDDFGTGHSTLEQLRRFPFTELKIDQAYVTGAAMRPPIRVMLESTVRMAHNLGLRVIAEGVETKEDWDLVTKLGCEEVQGFLVARPMPAPDVTGWLETKATPLSS